MWAITALSIVGVILNIKKNKNCFLIWTFTNTAWMAYDFKIGAYAQSALFAVYAVLAVYGMIEWSNNKNVQPKST